jgi:splicing factor U2AF subunit
MADVEKPREEDREKRREERASKDDKDEDRRRDKDDRRDRDRDRDRERDRSRDRDRDRDRRRSRSRDRKSDRRERSRSRDRDRDRRRSSSRDRSRRSRSPSEDKPRRKKSSNFSSAPDPAAIAALGGMGMQGMNPAMMQGMMQGMNPMMGMMGMIPGMMPGMAGMMQVQPGMPPVMKMGVPSGMLDASTKSQRELFIGNTPEVCNEQVLLEFLNAAMHQVNLAATPGNPIIQCRVNSNKYAFIELRSIEETNACLNITGIPFMGNMLKVGRPSKYSGPQVPSTTWQALTGAAPDIGTIDPNTKIYRELFVGNTGPEMNEVELQDFLGAAMQQVGLTLKPGNPIVTTRMSGKFAFVEMRSIEETNSALNLNGIPYKGFNLRVGRPSKYNGPVTPHMEWNELLAKFMAGELQPGSLARGATATAAAAPASDLPPYATSVIRLTNMVTGPDLEDDEEFRDILEDTREECSKFGEVIEVVIPRGSETGVGLILVEFRDAREAHKAATALAGRTFDGRRVEASFYDESKFASRTFD